MLMRRSPSPPTRRSVRAVAALCALMLVASNAIAAMGMCAAKAPAAPQPREAATAEPMPCPQHDADAGSGVLPDPHAAAPHCPQDDPGAQARAGDVPAADAVLMSPPVRVASACPDDAQCRVASTDESPPTPLYARLSRLLL